MALIPVLGLVLYALLPGETLPEFEAVTPPSSARPAAPAETTRSPVPILASVRPIEQIVEQDPFALPDPLAPAPAAELVVELPPDDGEPDSGSTADTWESIRGRWSAARTSIVLTTSEGPVAVVGEKHLRIGDEVEPGVRVVDIRPEGVVLEVDEVDAAASGETE